MLVHSSRFEELADTACETRGQIIQTQNLDLPPPETLGDVSGMFHGVHTPPSDPNTVRGTVRMEGKTRNLRTQLRSPLWERSGKRTKVSLQVVETNEGR